MIERDDSQQDSKVTSDERQSEERSFRNAPPSSPCLLLVEAHQDEAKETGKGKPVSGKVPGCIQIAPARAAPVLKDAMRVSVDQDEG